MDITTTHRSHWVAADGTRHAMQRKNWRKRTDLQPVLNLDEVRDYVALGLVHLPGDASTPDGTNIAVWSMRQLLDSPKTQSRHMVAEICGELTDSIPIYNEQWRARFVAMREKYPAVE